MKTKSWRAELRGCCFFAPHSCLKVIKWTTNQPMLLTREPDNPVDKNAILVGDLCGDNASYVAKEVAAEVAPYMDRGVLVLCKIIRPARPINGRKWAFPVALLWTQEEETDTKEETRAPIRKEKKQLLPAGGDDLMDWDRVERNK